MKQEANNLATTLASEDDRSEPTSPEFVEEREEEAADLSGQEPSDEGDDEGPIDLRKKPNEKTKMVVGPGSNAYGGHRPETATPSSTEALLDIFQRTLMNAGLPPYLSPLLFFGGAAASDELAKAMAERVTPNQLPYPYRTLIPNAELAGSQTPVVCDPSGRRHILVQSPDGNVMTIPLTSENSVNGFEKSVSGLALSKSTAFKKRDYYAQKDRDDEDSYSERNRYRILAQQRDEQFRRRDPYSSRPKSELVSRLESAPVLDYLAYRESAEKRASRRGDARSRTGIDEDQSRNSEPEDLSLAGSDASNEEENHPRSRAGYDHREWDTYSHRGRWGQPDSADAEEEARRFFRSRSCSDLFKFKTIEERERQKADGLTPASLSCPSLAATSSSDQHRHHHIRKRKFVTHHEDPRDDPEDEEMRYGDQDEDDDEERGGQAEIVNAPITRLFNPKKSATITRPKIPRLFKMDERLDSARRELRENAYVKHSETRRSRYNEDDEDEVLRQSRYASNITPDGSRMTPEQETFLERLRHSAPVPWNVYSYYTQMMRNLTEPHHREVYQDTRPSSNVSSPSPQRSLHQTVTSSYQPSRSPDTTNASPPNSLLVAAIASGIGNGLQNGLLPPGSPSLPDSRKAARVLTGKHVRQGTGASPATLLTLRQKIQERQRAKEMSSQTTPFGRSTINAKVGRDLKRKNQLPPSIPLVNKSR